MSQKSNTINRRALLKAAAVAVAAPTIVPSSVFGKDAPSETMLMGSIGTGRMGRGDMQECIHQGLKANARVVAVCDLDSDRAASAKALVEKIYTDKLGAGKFQEVKAYGDFRELLARKDIDGVTVSTPDHQHAVVAIAAAKLGKSVYLQKPLTNTVGEGKALVKAVRENKAIFQTGSQQRSDQYFRRTCEAVRNGFIGKLHTIEVTNPTDRGYGKYVEMDVPSNLNYDMWVGPRPMKAYTEHRVHPRKGYGRPGWLQIEDYSRGMITGWGAHMFDIAQWGHGGDADSGPVSINCRGQFPDRGLFNVHTSYKGEAMYADGVKMTSGSGRAGVKFIGDEGWIWVERGSFKASDPKILREKIPANGIHLYESKNHMMDLLDSMRKGKDPAVPVEVGHRSNTICVLHHIAMKIGRPLKWDPKTELFVNDKEADKWLDYEHRAPWKV